MSATNRTRRWLRFSLRTLLVAVTALCVWLGWHMHKRCEQLRIAAAVSELGGKPSFLLRDLSLLSSLNAPFTLPNDFWFNNVPIDDRNVQLIASAPQCLGLHLADNQISDVGLAALERRTDLLV